MSEITEEPISESRVPEACESLEHVEITLEDMAEIEADYIERIQALEKRAAHYEYMVVATKEALERKLQWHAMRIDAYLRPHLKEKGKAQYRGAFGDYRITKRKNPIKVTDKRACLGWCEKQDNPLFIKRETKTVESPDVTVLKNYVERTGDIPDGVELQEMEHYSIKLDKSALKKEPPHDG